GADGTQERPGGAGGVVTIDALGPVTITSPVPWRATRGAPDAFGGGITGLGAANIEGATDFDVSAGGSASSGGSSDIDCEGGDGDINVRGHLIANGADGGDITLNADGSVTVDSSSRLEANGRQGAGGIVDIFAQARPAGRVDISGDIEAVATG